MCRTLRKVWYVIFNYYISRLLFRSYNSYLSYLESNCHFEELDGLVANQLESETIVTLPWYHSYCRDQCAKMGNCMSFNYCECLASQCVKRCILKTKILTENDPLNTTVDEDSKNCWKTTIRKCKLGKVLNCQKIRFCSAWQIKNLRIRINFIVQITRHRKLFS